MINITQLNKLRTQINKNKTFLDKLELKADDDKKHSIALSMSILMEYFNLNQTTAYSAITDGGEDNKIDAFYYSDDEDELSELIIVQAKFKNNYGETSTFSEDDIKLCISNCKQILNGQNFQKANDVLTKKIDNYRKLLKDNDSPAISIKLFFATNGVIHEGHKSLKEVIDCQEDNINVLFIDATLFGEEPSLQDGELNINLKNEADKTDSIFSFGDELFSGRIASCSIKELMEFYKNSGELNLLSANVRYTILSSNINKEIQNSFINDPKRFCYLNNGITLICSEYSISPTGQEFTKIKLTKPSIVNGGQTISTLYHLYNNEDVYQNQFRDSKILIRIYKAPKEYAIKIAQATNSQNPINVVDLRSNDVYQEKAKRHFSKLGIGLITKKGEDTTYFDNVITNEHILQIYASLYGDDPAVAKTSKAAIFKKYYDLVFNDKIDETMNKKLYRCYQISNFIEQQTSEDKVILQNAFYSLIYTMKKINLNIINENIPEKNILEHFASAFEISLMILNEIINKKRDELKIKFSMNNLFKSKEIKDLIDLKLENGLL